MHLKLCENNKSNSGKLLTLEKFWCIWRRSRYRCLLTLRDAHTFRNMAEIMKNSKPYDIYGTCDSLLLISRSQNFMYKGMRLCNPSIRKSLLLPPFPLVAWDGYNPVFVLGFATRSDDYKVIAISIEKFQDKELPVTGVAVYTLSDHQWAIRDNVLNIDHFSFKNLFGPYYYCDGAAHWLGSDPYDVTRYQFGKPTHLFSLDFDTESFTFLELPHTLDEIHTTSTSLFLLKDSLVFFCISDVSFRIWVLKHRSGERMWTLWFSGTSSCEGFYLLRYMGSRSERVLYYEGDAGGYLVYRNSSYSIVTCQVLELGKALSHNLELATYYESLVLCNKDGTEDMV